jgi:serine/threonine protein kinase
MTDNRETIGDYILLDKLGKGAYGVVFKAINIYEGNTVAVKKLSLKGCSKEVVDSLTVTFTSNK